MPALGALILCGGQSRRMGRPKAWLPFGPEVLLQRVVRLVSVRAQVVVVVAGPLQALPSLPQSVVVARDPTEGHGPLQGIASGLAALPDEVEWTFVTATDVPFLQATWIDRLLELREGFDLVLPVIEGFEHPLSALYRRSTVLPVAQRLLAEDQRRLGLLKGQVRARLVSADELRDADPTFASIRNLNTMEDYQSALESLSLD